jgi:hypothetical protein
MSGLAMKSTKLFAVAAVLISCGPVQADLRIQQIADEAALAAVQVLAAGGQTDDAIAIARQTAARIPGVAAEITASPDLVVRVKLAALDSEMTASSTARYRPPDQPANFAWASRQRFVVKPSPFIVGSACVRDCESDRLR